LALQRVLQSRALNQVSGVQRRYFFVRTVRRSEGERVMMTVRVEQGRDVKQVETEASRDVVANLKWFYDLGFGVFLTFVIRVSPLTFRSRNDRLAQYCALGNCRAAVVVGLHQLR
jgi:hypothetical protein